MITIGSLFSGIGGFEIGLEAALNAHTLWQVESDPSARAVLAERWPKCDRSVTDVKEAGAQNLERVNIVCGGFPCQDLSAAGKKAGLEGDKSSLAFEQIRIIEELRPNGAVIENSHHGWRKWVPFLRRSLWDRGYSTMHIRLRADELGAPHPRSRCFILAVERFGCAADAHNALRPSKKREAAHCPGELERRAGLREEWRAHCISWARGDGTKRDVANANRFTIRDSDRIERIGSAIFGDDGALRWRAPKDGICGVDDGVSHGVDPYKKRRNRHLGNAVVPQVAFAAGIALLELQLEVGI